MLQGVPLACGAARVGADAEGDGDAGGGGDPKRLGVMFVWETASPIGCRTTTPSNRHVGGEHMLVPASTSLKAHQESFLTGKVISHRHRIRVHVYRCIGAGPVLDRGSAQSSSHKDCLVSLP